MITVNGNELVEYLRTNFKAKVKEKGRFRKFEYRMTLEIHLFSWVKKYFEERGYIVVDSYDSYLNAGVLAKAGQYSKLKIRKDGAEGMIKVLEDGENAEVVNEKMKKKEFFSRKAISIGNEQYWRKPIPKMGNVYFCDWSDYKALVWVFDTSKGGWDGYYDYSVILFPKDEFDVVVSQFSESESESENMDYVLENLI
jgi:hypothetical protein